MKNGIWLSCSDIFERQVLESSNCNWMPRLFTWLHSNIAGFRSSLLGHSKLSSLKLIINWSSTQDFYPSHCVASFTTLPFGWWNVTAPVLAAGRWPCAMAWRLCSIELDSRWMAGDSEAGHTVANKLNATQKPVETCRSMPEEMCICRHNVAGCEYAILARFPRSIDY